MSEILKADFRNARVGDRVKCLYGVDGIIEAINIRSGEFSVDCSNSDSVIRINENGFTEHGICPVWFYYFEGQFPTIEACTRPLPKIEVDEKILVWHGVNEKWNKEHFSHYCSSGLVVCWGWGKTSFTGDKTDTDIPRKYWKLASDETINSGNLHEIEGEK